MSPTTDQLNRLLEWLQATEIGEGDLTTESVAPHAFHVQGAIISSSCGLFYGEEIIDLLLEPTRNQLELNWHLHSGDTLQPNDLICQFAGNGAEILKNRRLITYILGRLSALATATREAVTFLAQFGKKLTAGHQTEPFWEVFDREAYLLGGMEIHHQGLQDNIYLTPLHFAYAGAPVDVIRRVGEELAEVRKVVKIEVEVNSIELLQQVNACDCDVIHLVDFSKEDIRYIFENIQFNRRPVLHLPNLEAFEPVYADYFFRYTVIEALHQARPPLEIKIVLNKGD